MIAIIDYGMGNLRSVEKALTCVGGQPFITSRAQDILTAEAFILPGVGAFGEGMENIKRLGLVEPICAVVERGRPLLGICLGMQLLFGESEERGVYRGLGLLEGEVKRFPIGLKVPHIGWNELRIERQSPLLNGLANGTFVYFVHSYYVVPADASVVVAMTEYGERFVSVVARANIFGVQFHPEKSQQAGLTILHNFVSLASHLIVKGGSACSLYRP
ncbi:MAG: imidazole glycerol phosphate synthase subunit HisH [Chloroflexi bacterium]|nr:imidazole glycerol phosphate synthase subunit HisH [Chloroflexota bacterium]